MPIKNSIHWLHQKDSHDKFLTGLNEPKTTSYGMAIILETKRIYMDKTVHKAHELVSIVRKLLYKKSERSCLLNDFRNELLLVKDCEIENIENIIRIFQLNKSDEPCIKLEVALARNYDQSLLPLVNRIIKSENPERVDEVVDLINLIFDFIEKTTSNYHNLISRSESNSRLMKLLNIAS